MKAGGDSDAVGGADGGLTYTEDSPMRRGVIAAVIAVAAPTLSAGAQKVKQEVRELRDAKKEVNHDQRDRR